MKETYTIVVLLKFGAEPHMRQLHERGIVYMNALETFRDMEDESLRGDGYEGITKIRNYLPGEFTIPEINFTGRHEGVHLCEKWERLNGNLFSLYCVSSHGFPNPYEFVVDPRVKEFGTHLVMIKNLPIFLELIRNAFRKKGIFWEEGFVEYYDRYRENRDISVFEKPMEYAYQKEFRFYAHRQGAEPLILELGDLRGISTLLEVSAIESMQLVKTA